MVWLEFATRLPARLDRDKFRHHFLDYISICSQPRKDFGLTQAFVRRMVDEQYELFEVPVSPVPIVGTPIGELRKIGEAVRKISPYMRWILPSIIAAPMGSPDYDFGSRLGDAMQLLHKPKRIADMLQNV